MGAGMSFTNWAEAGRKLAARLKQYKDRRPVILALPRGGVPVAAEVAAAIDAPLDLVLVRRSGYLLSRMAMGAVVDGGSPLVIRNEDVIQLAGVDEAQFQAVCDSELAEIEAAAAALHRRSREDRCQRASLAIVVDDGVATGATTRAALRAARMRQPDKLVLAVPVGPTDTIAAMREEADEVVCLEDYEIFGAIGYFYDDFRQITDREVIEILARFDRSRSSPAKRPTQ